MNRQDLTARPSRPSTIGGSPAKQTVEVHEATPDNTDPQTQENQAADAVPTPQDTLKETRTTYRVRISATTVGARDT